MRNVFLILLFTITSCATPQQTGSKETNQDDFDALEQVEVKDGINKLEAFTIAKAYFWARVSGCGFPKEPSSEGDKWVSETLIGIAGLPGDPIFIDKENGEAFSGKNSKAIALEELKKLRPSKIQKR